MKIVSVVQGTPEWHAHRVKYFNASDAPVMLGKSAYKKRTDLLDEMKRGVSPEISDFTQGIMDKGHVFEAQARALAEAIVGEELYPCVGISGVHSASFDGITVLDDVIFEHKSMNDGLRVAFADIETISPEFRERTAGQHLPEQYRIQMEHQCLVSECDRALFMASQWTDKGDLIEEGHCWYYPDAELRATIVAGWEQFAADLKIHEPGNKPVASKHVGRAPTTLPALIVEVSGLVKASNLIEFKSQAMETLGNINRDLKTDEDFVDADKTVKWAKDVEDRIEATKANVLGQMQTVDEVIRTLSDVGDEVRRIRLELEKKVKAEKETRRASIVDDARISVAQHFDAINATLGVHAIAVPASLVGEIGNAIKGKKTLASIYDAANVAATAAKITASQLADKIRANIAILDEHAEHSHLFADRVTLCSSKSPDDVRNVATIRVSEYKKREAERLAKIEAEAAAKARREAEELAEHEADAEALHPSSSAEMTQSAPVAVKQAAARSVEPARTSASVSTLRPASTVGAAAGDYKAEVFDFRALVIEAGRRAQDGNDQLLELLCINQEQADKMAAVFGSKLSVPGIRAHNNQTVASRKN